MDKNMLFMEPQTNQYGSNMIMTNVNKLTKVKYLNIDTRFRDEYNYNENNTFDISFVKTLPDRYKYTITLPDIINNVKSMKVKSIEIPMTFNNISSHFENNYFTVTEGGSSGNATTVIIDDGSYNMSSLSNTISTKMTNYSSTYYDSTKYAFRSTSSSTTYINFSSTDKYNFKSSLGWLLGYRKPLYAVTSNYNIVPEFKNTITTPMPKYLYLAVDEFSKGVQNSFITPLSNAYLSKNILSRITIDQTIYDFGTVLTANEFTHLLSDKRSYTGKVNLQKICIQLINEFGMPVDLNGNDFSFCLEIEYD